MRAQAQVSAFRLRRHHLAAQRNADLVTICRNVCGIQAQVMASGQMALWARNHNLSRTEIHAALWEKRTLVRTSCMRGTLHLLPAADFPVYVSALKRSREAALWRIMARFGVTEKESDRLAETIVETLCHGPLTQGEVTRRIRTQAGKNMRKWMELFWSVCRPAITKGWVCYGPARGNEVTFVRTDQWLPKQKAVSEREAKQILLRRYLRAYGPATLQDFAKWSGIPTQEARAVWESLHGERTPISLGGQEAWILRKDSAAFRKSALGDPVLRLLPGFDPYLLGHAEKDQLVERRHYKRVYRNQGWISAVVLLDGRVIGTWSYTNQAKRLRLQMEPFGKLSPRIRARVKEEAASLGRFLETPCEVRFR